MGAAEWFGHRLRELREGAGLSRADLAEKAGISERAIVQWERGEREPSWSMVLALAAALEVDVNTFAQPPTTQETARGPGRPRKASGTAQETRTGAEPATGKPKEKRGGKARQGKRKGTS
jgi:transcriptional regulator with XRE-family HTH domain